MANGVIIQLRITGPERSEVYVVPPGVTRIGRQEGNEIRLVDERQMVSRRHARLECSETACQIQDLNSANGTFVNGERLTPNVPVALSHNSRIEIGPFQLVYEAIPIEPVKPAGPPSPIIEEKGEKPKVEPAPPAPPPAPPVLPFSANGQRPLPDYATVPPGLDRQSRRLLGYLPGIYHTDFMSRFLAIFEAILVPIEWNVDNFDLFLNPSTAPADFLPWLAQWFDLAAGAGWTEAQRRTLIAEAHWLYACAGTRRALSRVLEIYTGELPEISDTAADLPPHTFTVRLPVAEKDVDRTLLERLIDTHKPAHTSYTLEFGVKRKT